MIRRSLLVVMIAAACTPGQDHPLYPDGRVLESPGGAGSPYVAPTPAPPPVTAGSPGCGIAPAHVGAATSQHVTAAGHDRTYTLVVPDGYAPQSPYPLVFVLHGSGGTGAGARASTDLEKQGAGKAIFVYPDAVNGSWDLDTPAPTNIDVALFDALSLVTFNALCIASRRVFVVGFSNGAYMANQLACRRGERIRGIASHSGGGPYETQGTYDAQGNLVCAGKAVAALVVHGNNDATVPPTEGQKSIDHWSQANRCSAHMSIAPGMIAPCVAQEGCYQPVEICRIPGLGHASWKEAGRVTWQFVDGLK